MSGGNPFMNGAWPVGQKATAPVTEKGPYFAQNGKRYFIRGFCAQTPSLTSCRTLTNPVYRPMLAP